MDKIEVRKQKVLDITKGKIEEIKKREQKEREERRFLSSVNLSTQLGFLVVVPIAGGAFLGAYLDEKFGSSPKITLSLIFFGAFISFYAIYKITKEM